MTIIGIRREDKNEWERRIPLVPNDIKELTENYGYEFIVQPSSIRAFSDDVFTSIGATVQENLSPAKVVFAVKEMPKEMFQKDTAYIFFSHVIKGQEYNMPMLRQLMDVGATLIDYEPIVDDKNRRLIYFGNYAGLAGMIDGLWAFGQRLKWEGYDTPFTKIKQAMNYESLDAAKRAIADAASEIEKNGLPDKLVPLTVGFAGYGNVSRGAQEILDLFPIMEISPKELMTREDSTKLSKHHIYKVVFKEEDMVRTKSENDVFALQDYYDNPEKYEGVFEQYLPHLHLLVNCIYWNEQYPRLMSKDYLRQTYKECEQPKLRVVADISCDTEGSIECNLKSTESGDPVYVYNPFDDKAIMGIEGVGPIILAVDNLPGELPIESSSFFSNLLKKEVPTVADADYSVPFAELNISDAVKRAIIVYRGKLTPKYEYLKQHLNG